MPETVKIADGVRRIKMAVRRICVSCGEPFSPQLGIDVNLSKPQQRALQIQRKTRCEECAREVALGELIRTTTMHGTGGGIRVIRDPRGLGG